jgi:hypothetical protein
MYKALQYTSAADASEEMIAVQETAIQGIAIQEQLCKKQL